MLRPFALLLAVVPAFAQEPAADRAAKCEKEIEGIEKRLKEHPPAKDSIVFVGSSTIRLWDLKKSFPDLAVVNAGFGGSEVRDSTIFAERLLFPFNPKAIVFYAGDNDINSKRTAEQVRDDYREFVKTVRGKLPKTPIYFLAVKPSPSRWTMYDTQTKANGYVKEDCAKGENLKYVDTVKPMLGKDGGVPPDDLFKADKLHMSDKGYEIWARILAPMLK